MRTRLLITGKMGSGKSFAANYLEEEHGASRWSRTELMKRLAHAVADHIGSPDELLERIFPDPLQRAEVREDLLAYVCRYEPEPGKPRRLYQDITQICQNHDPLCFERELDSRIRAYGEGGFSLIDDVRSRAAFDYFTERGYHSLRIEASEETRLARMLSRDGSLPPKETLEHPSETELDDVEHEFTIRNETSDVADLYAALDRVLKEIRGA